MEKIDIINGKLTIPERHELSKDKKRLTIKTAWSSEVHRLDKECWQTLIQKWFRNKQIGEKPYIPEGFIEIDGVRYRINEG